MRRFRRFRFTHLMSPLIWEASLGQFEVDHDVVSLHPFSIDFRQGSSTETALSVRASPVARGDKLIPDDGRTAVRHGAIR